MKTNGGTFKQEKIIEELHQDCGTVRNRGLDRGQLPANH